MTVNRPMTRRSLLKRAAGWSIGAPWVIPSSALAAGENAPSERIGIGMIGLGDRGQVHLTGGMSGAFRTGSLRARKDIEIVAYCDVIESRLPKQAGGSGNNHVDFIPSFLVITRASVSLIVIAAMETAGSTSDLTQASSSSGS